MAIPFIDLKAQYSRLQSEIEEAVINTLRSGQYISGNEVGILESSLGKFSGVDHVISCSSGTDALVMALMAKGVGPGDAVFTVPFTFMATAEAIATVGATPIFVDVDPHTFNIDPQHLEMAINAVNGKGDYPLPRIDSSELKKLKPKGVIAVDLFGQSADYNSLNKIAHDNGLFMIEDAAQSYGGTYNGSATGGLAEIGCTSFFPAKPLGCYGDGGAIFTNDSKLAEVLRSIRVHGQGENKYENVRIGITGRLDTIQAAVLNVKLKVFAEEIESRNRVAQSYNRLIEKTFTDLSIPKIESETKSAWAQYTLIANDSAARKKYMSRLSKNQVPTMVYYSKCLHLQTAFSWLGYKEGDFVSSEDLSGKVFSLPMHPYLSERSVSEIVDFMGS